MSKYKHIFFDLDRTLWDFERNSNETLTELFQNHNLSSRLNTTVEDFLKVYRNSSAKSWSGFKKSETTRDEMRVDRFARTLNHYGIFNDGLTIEISSDYLSKCPYKKNLLPDTHEVLSYLKERYNLHIISNGFSESQRIKIQSSNLELFFREIIISEDTEYRKPQKGIFEFALSLANAQKEESIMVGDDWRNDIVGAMQTGLDQIYLDPGRKYISRKKPTFQIGTLKELMVIL